MSMAAAPSFICEEFPAVMSGAVSGSHDWAGGSAASFSRVPPRRMPSSIVSDSPVKDPSSDRRGTGTTSRLNVPPSQAAAARRWLSREKASISSRVISYRSASTWATRNWVHSRPSTLVRNEGGKGPVPPLALVAIGTRLIDSTPQATTMS